MRAFLLGTAQDGGIPQADCACLRCAAAAADPALRRLPSCVAVAAGDSPPVLLDAAWALPEQAARLRRMREKGTGAERMLPFAAILLTHAHMGHYTGLVHLGREGASARAFPVHCTRAMGDFLAANRPFAHLLDRGEINLRLFEPGVPFAPAPGLRATAIEVPHRNEDADTVCFRMESDGRSLLYLPDADVLPAPLVAEIRAADLALVDGTFYTHDEVAPGGRADGAAVPHPPVRETRKALAGARGRVLYTHLNHTNPLLSDADLAAGLAADGLGIAPEGAMIEV